MLTVEKDWETRTFVDRVKHKTAKLFKKLQVKDLKIYWNPREKTFLGNLGEDEEVIFRKLNDLIVR